MGPNLHMYGAGGPKSAKQKRFPVSLVSIALPAKCSEWRHEAKRGSSCVDSTRARCESEPNFSCWDGELFETSRWKGKASLNPPVNSPQNGGLATTGT